MKHTAQHPITEKTEHYEQLFNAIDINNTTVANTLFENCRFTHCDFKEVNFAHCKFINCYFKASDLSLLKLNNSSFNEVEFVACKMIGINWTQARWPNISLTSPLFFQDCDISLSSFFELTLPELIVTNCKAHEVDFRGCDLTHADLSKTDLALAEFMHTTLEHADFREALNYQIDPVENPLKAAKFSFPDVINLLQAFDIQISGIST